MKLLLPYPPSVNRYWRHVVLGKRAATLLSREAREYKARVAEYCLRHSIRRLEGPLVLAVDAYRPRKVGDLDGILKGLCDALQGFAFEDDKQIVVIHARRFDDKENPRVEVELACEPERGSEAFLDFIDETTR